MSRKPDQSAAPAVASLAPAAAGAAGLAPLPQPANALVAQSAPAAIDANGFDPAEYDWIPVKRKRRSDGWSHARQRAFIEALADAGSVTHAAREVGMSVSSCYRLRRSPCAGNFAAAWDAAIREASKRLVDIAFDRAIHGVEDPVLDADGREVFTRTRYNDRLLMFLLRAHHPERYRHAHRSVRHPDEPPAAEAAPIADALLTLEPLAPPAPYRLMPPDELDVALQVADILDGELPHWHRDRRADQAPDSMPLGPEFEAQLAAAKRIAAGLPPEPEARDDDDDDDGIDDEDAFWA